MFRPHFHVNRFLPANQKREELQHCHPVRGECVLALEISCYNNRLVLVTVRNVMKCIALCARMFHVCIRSLLGLFIQSNLKSSEENQNWFKNRVV